MLVEGGALVYLINSTIARCTANISGGGIFVSRGATASRVLLTDGTLLEQNEAPTGEGSAVFIEDGDGSDVGGVVHYVLPAPLGHYVNGIGCEDLYRDASDHAWSPCKTPQSHESVVPSMRGRLVERLPSGATDYEDYPYACDSGWYGDRIGDGAQSSAVCSGQCPAGSYCLSLGTVEPELCPLGHYCPAGSSSPVPVS